ncbi:MAG: hypothetical protein F6J97_07525 [Leptolyngbya sp. SIO4C1]|nr:hypothetical protein [Leptolyngbya sp. SIO4C1]
MQLGLTGLTGLVAIAFALTHLYGCRLRFLDKTPRSRWLSLSSGISVAYVFIHVLPDLSEAQHQVLTSDIALAFLEHHVYVMALIGMVLFYGLERLAKQSRQKNLAEGDGDMTEPSVFWLHMASFTLYNLLIGYLLQHREEPGLMSLLLYAIAMGTHFLVNDYGLRHHHKGLYRKFGRWILAAAVIAGWAVGSRLEISEAAVAVLFSLLAGSIILNVLKEELPEERESRYWTFALGAGGYAAVLLTA